MNGVEMTDSHSKHGLYLAVVKTDSNDRTLYVVDSTDNDGTKNFVDRTGRSSNVVDRSDRSKRDSSDRPSILVDKTDSSDRTSILKDKTQIPDTTDTADSREGESLTGKSEMEDMGDTTVDVCTDKSDMIDSKSTWTGEEELVGELTRDTWSRRFDFIISCVGAAVGFGNVWRFPYLCYKNGGGAFLVPYVIAVLTVGFPVMFLEVTLGQYMTQGGIGMWDVCPLMKGVAVCTTIFAYFEIAFYVNIFAWVLLYLGNSFSDPLPWSHCNNTWNSIYCYGGSECITNITSNNLTSYTVDTMTTTNFTLDDNITLTNTTTRIDPAVEFWRHYVLEISEGLDHPGTIVWRLLLCLISVYVIIYLCIWKGIKWISKIAYVTATAPYILLTVLLIMGCMKEGAVNGIIFYLKPDLNKLVNIEVWYAAFSQVMFSYAVGLNLLPALGSYNKFNTDSYSHTIVVATINSLTSLFSGFVIFTLLGHMAFLQQVPVDQVASSGPGLAFIVYPSALAQLPVPQLWSVVFFLMLCLLGIDSAILLLEGFAVSLMDVYTNLGKRREMVMLVTCFTSFLLGLPMITQGGMYVFQLEDYFVFGGFLLWVICLMEVVGIGWFYGADRFYDNLELMFGFRINVWMKICWMVLTPLIIVAFLVYQLVTFEPLVYDQTYVYPRWANGLGVSLAVLVLLVIPIVMVYKVLSLESGHGDTLKKRLKFLLRPKLKEHQIPEKWYSKDYSWTKVTE